MELESERVQLHKSLVNEITKGMEQVKELKVSSSNNEQERVLERMLSSHQEALLILTGRAPQGQCQSVISSLSDPAGSSTSVFKVSEPMEASSGSLKRFTKRDIPIVKFKTSGASSGLALDDGYVWRKYGQKDILGSKYPRGYYRCTHRHSQGCPAVKIVQRSEVNPTIFDVVCKGVHTCQPESKLQKPNS